MTTDRLYYHDSYLTRFDASVIDASDDRTRVYLNRTAFYPTSGGQPYDLGLLGGVPVRDVEDEGDRIAHVLAEPLAHSAQSISGEVAWPRRFDHMQQHTGQHLLSAVFIDVLGAPTLSFHLGADASNIDIQIVKLELEQVRAIERRANDIVFENRPVSVTFRDSSEDLELRKATEREGMVRIVSIADLDRSACGGTHVRATGEIGPILIRKLDRVRNSARIEFVCGLRAVRRARADYEALSAIARTFSSPLDDAPALVASQNEKLLEAGKVRTAAENELAAMRGRQLYADTPPDASGLKRVIRDVPTLSEAVRAEAQSFTAASRAVFMAFADDPPSVLIAASKDSGLHAGQRLKEVLTEAGGRGGGSAQMAQGSVPSRESLAQVREALS